MDKESTRKMAKAIKLSPVIQVLQLTAYLLEVPYDNRNSLTQPLSVALAEFRFCHLGKHFHGTT
jgi:hypothetical protein